MIRAGYRLGPRCARNQAFEHSGDAVFVEEPTYDRTITLFRRHQVDLVGIPMESDGLDTEFLAERLKELEPELPYLIPDFQNRAGITTSVSKREAIVELAQSYGFWVVEDCPYSALRYEGNDLPTILSMNPERVLHLSSFSKVLSPGIRVGYLVAPRDLVTRLAKVAEDTYVTPSLISQGIGWEFCRQGWLQPHVDKLKGLCRPRLKEPLSSLAEHLPQAGWNETEGGFFAEGGGERFLRLPFPPLAREEIREGISRLGKAAKRATSLGA